MSRFSAHFYERSEWVGGSGTGARSAGVPGSFAFNFMRELSTAQRFLTVFKPF